MRRVAFHPEADNEVIEAARYYETRSAGPIIRGVSQLDQQHNVSIKKEGTMSK